MFKKFSKLMLLALSVLTVFTACSISVGDFDGEINIGDGFLDNVVGKSFQLVTETDGIKDYIDGDGDIISADGRTVLYSFEGYINSTNGIYSKGNNRFFGVQYVSDNQPLRFYLKSGNGSAVTYWYNAENVKFIGSESILATRKQSDTMINGSIPSKSIKDRNVKSTGILSAVFSIIGNKLFTLVDGEVEGTLYTGSIVGSNIQTNDDNVVASVAIAGMRSDSLQLIGVVPYIVTPDTATNTLNIYDKTGTLMAGSSSNSISDVKDYAIGSSSSDHNVFYIITNNVASDTAKLYKVDSTGITGSGTALSNTDMIPQSVAVEVLLGTTDVYIAGLTSNGLVVEKITEAGITSTIPDGDINTAGRDIKLFFVKDNLHAIVGTSIYRSTDDGAWSEFSAKVPSDIFSIIVDDLTLYFTFSDTTTVAYEVDSVYHRLEVVGLPSTIPSGLVGGVTPAVVGHSSFGILIADVEKMYNTNNIMYNNIVVGRGELPFTMPPTN